MDRKYCGVDLHKKSFTACWIDEKGKKSKPETYSTDAKGYAKFKKKLNKKVEVAVESSGNTGFFYDSIVKEVKKVTVINPHKFKVVSESVTKNDARDAGTIAEFLKKDILPGIRMKSLEERDLQKIIAARDKLVKCRSTIKNQLHGVLNSSGIVTEREMFGSDKQLDSVIMLKGLRQTDKIIVQSLVNMIKSLNKEIRELEEKINESGSNLKGFENITSITGVGKLSGTILLNAIGNIKMFSNEKKLAAYFGMVPSNHDSAGKQRHGHITKYGNKIARTTLVQVTLIAIKYSDYLKQFYNRLKAAKGAGKAIIATARKMLGIIYNTLTNDLIFEDFTKFEIKKV